MVLDELRLNYFLISEYNKPDPVYPLLLIKLSAVSLYVEMLKFGTEVIKFVNAFKSLGL